MEIEVNGHAAYCYTGGKTPDPAKPTVLFIHGGLNDHSVWILQSRYFANHGWNVLCPDLPGHCRSQGTPPATVEAAADFIVALIRAAGLGSVALVGHSFGSLIAMEVAAREPALVTQLALIGTAFPMKVSDALLQGSVSNPVKAMEMVNVLSRSTLAAPPSALGPGTWVYGGSLALAKRVFASHPATSLAHNNFHASFKACNDYAGGEIAMARVACPVLFILGTVDQMTPARAAQGLIKATKNARVAMVTSGHHQMAEAAEQTLEALKGFLTIR